MRIKKSFQHIIVEIENHLASVTINRPPVNALNQQLVRELTDIARSLAKKQDVWIIALRASGGVFSAGADLKERSDLTDKEISRVVKKIQRMVYEWTLLPQPVIVGLQGPTLGGGLEIALASDIIAAADTAILGFPEVSLGIIPAAGGTQLLTRRTSLGVAKKWILSAKRFSAQEAFNDNVVDFVLPTTAFEQEFRQLLNHIQSNAPLSLRQAKKSISKSFLASLKKGLRDETKCYNVLIGTKDRKEAITAFLEKRQPIWKGK
jgi:enoyl-CoA hydratase/carnithine racemase